MANEQNLLKGDDIHNFTHEEASRGGKASARARAAKRDLRKALESLLEKEYSQRDKDGKITGTLTGTEAITAKLFEQAMKGNIRAFETLRDTIGQKPVERVMIAEVEPDVIEEVERAVMEDDSDTSDTVPEE